MNRAWAGHAGYLLSSSPTNVSFPFCGSQYPQGCSVAELQVITKPLPGGGAAILVLNHGDGPTGVVTVDLTVIQQQQGTLPCAVSAQGCKVRDVWAHADAGVVVGGQLKVSSVLSHDSAFLVLSPV